MSGDRGTNATNVIGVITAVVGLVTALIVLVATLGGNQGGNASHPPPVLTAATQSLPILFPPASGRLSSAPSGTDAAAASAGPAFSPTPGPTVPPSASPAETSAGATPAPTAAPSGGGAASSSAPPSAAPTTASTPGPPPTPTPRLTATPAPTAPPTPAPTRRPIAFYSVRDDPGTQAANADLFTVDSVTVSEHRLTTETEPDSDPAWSPDGTRLAFDSRRAGGRRDIWVLEANGSFTRITNDATDDAQPVWSPDGTQLAWSRGAAGTREIWIGGSQDGAGAHRITSGHDDIFPSWSSSGLIAFQRRDATSEVWVVDPDRSGAVVRITAAQGGGSAPAWSPDGRRIAFVRLSDGVNRIYIVNADGVTALRSLTPASTCDCDKPTWSPDGTQIAFVGPKGTVRALFVISAAGGTPRRVTTNGLAPFWGS